MRRFWLLALIVLVAASGLVPCLAQGPVPRQITGQVRLGGQAEPAGIPIVLQIVSSRYVTPAHEAEVARTVTDRKGSFTFDHLESLGRNGGREFFAVSAQPAGYARAFQIVDLTFAARGEATLVLEKEKAKTEPQEDVPSGPTVDNIVPAPAAPPRRSMNPEAREAMTRAQNLLFREHNAAASVEEFKKAIKNDPWYGPGYVLLGLAYMQLRQWSDAKFAFTEATKVEPGNVQAYVGLGSAMNEQHDYAGAQKALEHALDLNPDSAEAHYELARTFASLEKWEEAAPHARRAMEINPGYAGPHALLGNIYLMQEDLPFALAEFQEYLRLDPDGSLAPSVKQLIEEIRKSMAETPKKRP
jgi:tetratricopeptide (TPR) repeat protein